MSTPDFRGRLGVVARLCATAWHFAVDLDRCVVRTCPHRITDYFTPVSRFRPAITTGQAPR